MFTNTTTHERGSVLLLPLLLLLVSPTNCRRKSSKKNTEYLNVKQQSKATTNRKIINYKEKRICKAIRWHIVNGCPWSCPCPFPCPTPSPTRPWALVSAAGVRVLSARMWRWRRRPSSARCRPGVLTFTFKQLIESSSGLTKLVTSSTVNNKNKNNNNDFVARVAFF